MTVSSSVISGSRASAGFQLPRMREVKQEYTVLPSIDPEAAIAAEWAGAADALKALHQGAQVAVAVGSRGIADIVPIVRAVVGHLKQDGLSPFIIPAMGSHGGATSVGQTQILNSLGLTEHEVGAPIRATMEVETVGRADGVTLFLDRIAWAADGIVLVNRIAPHTGFRGSIESGLLKMLVVGLGNREGANWYHRAGVVDGLGTVILRAGRALLRKAPVVLGVAILENADHETAGVRITAPEGIEATERELLQLSRSHRPSIPVSDIDLLVVDEMGKDISGAGLDPAVVGRLPESGDSPHPSITRIFVRRLTPASNGNASGLGYCDAITSRMLHEIDLRATTLNAFTCCCPEDAKLPAVFESDRAAIVGLLGTVRHFDVESARLVHLKNTLHLGSMRVSEGCLPRIASMPGVVVLPEIYDMSFDEADNLASPFEQSTST